MALPINGNFLPTVRLGVAQEVAIGASSAQSAAFGTAGHSPNKLLRLCATVGCRLAFGVNPTATATGAFLPADAIEYIELLPGDKVAVIQEASGGKLSIVECIV